MNNKNFIFVYKFRHKDTKASGLILSILILSVLKVRIRIVVYVKWIKMHIIYGFVESYLLPKIVAFEWH